MFNNINPVPNSVVSLKKNGVLLTSVFDTSGSDVNDMGSNAVVIPLEVGDTVYVELHANREVYDDGMGYNYMILTAGFQVCMGRHAFTFKRICPFFTLLTGSLRSGTCENMI